MKHIMKDQNFSGKHAGATRLVRTVVIEGTQYTYKGARPDLPGKTIIIDRYTPLSTHVYQILAPLIKGVKKHLARRRYYKSIEA